MTDLDSTQIISADESIVQNTSVVETEATLKVLSGTEPQTYHINKETIIGRSAPSDLVIAAPSLSKQHAKITFSNGQYFITDLGSSNKTFQNKVQLQANVCYALHEGDEIKFGDILCSFHEQKSNDQSETKEIQPETTSKTESKEKSESEQPVNVVNGNSEENNHTNDSSSKSNGTIESSTGETESNPTDEKKTDPSETTPSTSEENNTMTKMEETPASSDSSVPSTKSTDDPSMEISAAPTTDAPSTDDAPSTVMDTNASAVCTDSITDTTVETMENSSPRPASEQLNVVPVSALVEQLEEVEKMADEPISKEQIEVTINEDVVKESLADDQMETEQTKPTTINDNEMPVDEKPVDNPKIDEPAEMIINEEKPETSHTMEAETDPEATSSSTNEMVIDETPKATTMDEESTSNPTETVEKIENTTAATVTETTQPTEANEKAAENNEPSKEEPEPEEGEGEGDEEEEEEADPKSSGRPQRGLPRKNVRRARGRRAAASRARVVSTKIHGTRRQAQPTTTNENNEENNQTLEETINTEPEESPEKVPPLPPVEVKETRPKRGSTKEQQKKESTSTPVSPPKVEPETETKATAAPPSTTDATPTVRSSARIKERASSGRNRQFPYTDDYVDLDDLEKQSKANHNKSSSTTPAATTTTSTATNRKSSGRERASASPQKRESTRPKVNEKSKSPTKANKTDVYDQMDVVPEINTTSSTTPLNNRKRKSVTTPVTTANANKRSRPTPPQTASPMNTRRKGTSTPAEPSPSTSKSTRRTATTNPTTPPPAPTTSSTTPKRGSRKSTKNTSIKEESPTTKATNVAEDRPVRIALSSHLNFNNTHLEVLRSLGFEIMDESCQVDALVVDRIRRTKKFFMCLARGAHILSPTWIETMIKDKTYVSYEKFYLEDTNAETRYGFKLRDSVRLAKQRSIFANYKFFCTKDTSPPYEDLKDIIEAGGGTMIAEVNMSKPGKDLICIVAQSHKNEYEDLFRRNVPIVSEEFVLSGISKQKLDFDTFSLFQNATTVKSTGK